jgi:hypothetical protein
MVIRLPSDSNFNVFASQYLCQTQDDIIGWRHDIRQIVTPTQPAVFFHT